MAEKIFKYTVDCESDWGGRSPDIKGIGIGLPIILEKFKIHKIKAIFFISTELIEFIKKEVKEIQSQDHKIGSHGHFHIKYGERWRAEQDYQISNTLLSVITGTTSNLYRAPKFSYVVDDSIYSNPNNHQGLLKMMWFKEKPKSDSIFYLHPFDLVGSNDPPNIFCKLWYSRPKDAKNTLDNLLSLYPTSYIVKKSKDKA